PRDPRPREVSLVLASGSPRRRQLLEMLGLEFRIVAPNVDETRGSSELPEEYVTRLAREKARVVAGRERGAVVLAADTTVVLRGAIFEKPQTPAQAVEMLAQLAGRTHQVMTAVAVARDGRLAHAVDVTDVTFRPLSGDQIAAYVATGEPMDKAGAYAIQGRRLAVFTASPITVYSSRRSEPTLPANTSPKLMPSPMPSSGRPCSFHFVLSFWSAAS